MLEHVSEFPSFLKLNDIPLCVYTTFCFFPSSINGHLGCFYVLAIVNNAAINIGIQIHVQVPVFNSFGYIPRSGIAGSYGNSTFKFLGAVILFASKYFFILNFPVQIIMCFIS